MVKLATLSMRALHECDPQLLQICRAQTIQDTAHRVRISRPTHVQTTRRLRFKLLPPVVTSTSEAPLDHQLIKLPIRTQDNLCKVTHARFICARRVQGSCKVYAVYGKLHDRCIMQRLYSSIVHKRYMYDRIL